MARLQDFQTAIPASSDKLLVVQSQGQGLSTIDTMGAFMANNSTVSSLNTTSKKVSGAINEIIEKTTSTVTTDTDNVDRTAVNSLIKKNGMVQFDLIFYPKALNTLQNKLLATVPTGYRPSTNIVVAGTLVPVYNQLSKTMVLELQITSLGDIRCPNNGAYAEIGAVTTNTQISLHCCYFV